jgi:hypothetical protein
MIFTAETHDCRDAGDRVTQGAVTERAQRKAKAGSHRKGAKNAMQINTKETCVPLGRILV